MFRVVGFVTAFLLVLVASPYWFRQLNKFVLKLPPKKVGPILKTLRLIHKPAGLAFFAIAATHGYMALGAFQLHTGTIAWLAFAVTASLGVALYFRRKPPLFKMHKGAALTAVLLVLVHLFFPSLLYYLF